MTAQKRHVALFEFSVWDKMVPLVSGLLEAGASARPELRDTYRFSKYSTSTGSAAIDRVVDVEADVYAFSCYVWNTGLVRRILPALLAKRPRATILLGGPQVMNKAASYLPSDCERVAVCNGEGEITFSNYLAELLNERPDLSRVNGLSFYRDGLLVDTPKQDRIADLDSYPSPYLEGCFAGERFVYGVIETNRGCPFKCTYCYWGASTNSKVRKQSEGRVFQEIEWLSEQKTHMILIADANFGMLKRDQDIAAHIVACKAKYGFPMTVSFSASKNTPDKNAQLVKVLADSGLLSTLPIAIQSTNPEVLKNVDRSNISSEGYIQLQNAVNERGQSSYVELIWPLPGETLTSFRAGIEDLFRQGASTFNAHPLMLINNVEMDDHRERFGLVTVPDQDPNSEASLVVSTASVSAGEYLDGLRYMCHVTALLSCRGLAHTAKWLDQREQLSLGRLFARFDEFCLARRDHPYMAHVGAATSGDGAYSFAMLGSVFHLTCGVLIREFDELLHEFLQTLDQWSDPRLRALFALDLLNRPYAYRNTRIVERASLLQGFNCQSLAANDRVQVEVPSAHVALIAEALGVSDRTCGTYEVSYKSEQYPYLAGKKELDYHTYCTGMLLRMNAVAARWTPLGQSREFPLPGELHANAIR